MDLRSKKIVFLSHCILNQNSVVENLARAKGAYRKVVEIIMDNDIGICQLTCPEMIYLGMERKSMTREEYDTYEYHKLCESLAEETIEMIKNYLKNDYKIVGIIGINHSPTCSLRYVEGIFMEELLKKIRKFNLEIPVTDISTNYVEGKDNSEEINELKKFLKNNLN